MSKSPDFQLTAVSNLANGGFWAIEDGVVSFGETDNAPTDAEIEAEIARLQADYEAKQYQRDRAAEYPPIGDQLDALWKGGTAAEEMLGVVMAVKSKYPKPE
jgi:hypothetical protein